MDSVLRAKLKRLIEHPDWEVIYPFIAYIKEKWHNAPVKVDDEFNTMWNVAHKEGKIEGLTEFINNVEQLALDQ